MGENEREVVPASRYLALIVPITNFAIEIWGEANGTTGTPAQQTAHGLLDRAICWLRTLQDLTEIHHYQGNLAAVRGLLETTVDLAYLTKDRGNNDRLEAWELSAKFKAAESVCGLVDPKVVPRFDMEQQRKFVQLNAERVKLLRERHWPRRDGKRKHPDRWTGLSLIDDIRALKESFPGWQMERTYHEMYAHSCWGVHGSGLIVTRTGEARASAVAAAMGMSILSCGELAFAIAEMAATILGLLSRERVEALRGIHAAWRRADSWS